MNNKEVVKRIDRIFERMRFTQFYSLSYVCPVDSLVRIDDEECSCRGCIYGYSVRCMSPMIMEEEVKVFV